MEEKREPIQWRLWCVAAMGLLVAYPLSYGPVAYLAVNNYLPLWFVELSFYKPLDLLSDHSSVFEKAFGKYMDWWFSAS